MRPALLLALAVFLGAGSGPPVLPFVPSVEADRLSSLGSPRPAEVRPGLAAQVPPPPPAPPAPPATPPPDLVPLDAAASGDEAFGAPLATDTLRPRPAPDLLDAYRADPDFQYDDPQAEGPSLWERLWDWLRRTVWQPVAESTSAGFREAVVIGLAVLVLGWAVARLLRVEGGGVFARRDGSAGTGAPLLDAEEIAGVDLDARLRDALNGGDHREAVRVRYLRLLQALDAAGALAWRRDKTNRQYVAEVAGAAPALAAPFRRATRVFDAVWYGERPVSADLYAELAPLFDRAAPDAHPATA